MPEGCRSTIKALGTAAALLLIAGIGALVVLLLRDSQPAPSPAPPPAPPPRTATAPAPAYTPVSTPTPLILPSVTPPQDATAQPVPTEPTPAEPTPTALIGIIETGPEPPPGTPEPPPAVIAIRDSQAEEVVMQQAANSGLDLKGLDLTFDAGQVVATGELRIAGLLGKAIEGPFRIVGRPRLEDGVLKAELTGLTVRGTDVTSTLYRPMLETIANDWLAKWLGEKRVASVTLQGGTAALVFAE